MDLIRAVVREEVTASEQRTIETLRGEIAASAETLRREIAASAEGITAATTANLSELRAELLEQIGGLGRRTERSEVHMNAILMQMAGISQSLTASERFDNATAGTLAGIQKAIDGLSRRVEMLEKKAS